MIPLLAPLLGSLAGSLLPASVGTGIAGALGLKGATAGVVAGAAPKAIGAGIGTLLAGGDLGDAALNAVGFGAGSAITSQLLGAGVSNAGAAAPAAAAAPASTPEDSAPEPDTAEAAASATPPGAGGKRHAPPPRITEAAPTPPQPVAHGARGGQIYAGPAVRKLAREFGVDLALVAASGPRERIVKDDVASYVKHKLQQPTSATAGAGIPSIADQDFSNFGEAVEHQLSRIQQLTAANMARNWLNIPHVTQFDEADVTELETFRNSLKREMEKRGVKLSPLAFIVKVCAAALQEFPQFNVSLRANGTHYVQKHYVHIGIAVDTPNGLLVPVIRDADQKSIWTIAEEIIDLATRGRKGQIKSNEMQGGCFTISSLGGLGGTAFTPIVNAPEVAILGVSKNQIKPFWNGSSFEPRTFTPLSLSYDHRAVNGADAARFTTYLCEALQDMRCILL
jgi:pyruvate dehydrogenase E2 component (dihydrolipoamide acetyltransferase)